MKKKPEVGSQKSENPSRSLGKAIAPHTALWSEPLGPHALKNVGANDLHIISVEIKNKIIIVRRDDKAIANYPGGHAWFAIVIR